MEIRSLLICLGGFFLVSCTHATGPLLEAEGWTPVRAPQPAELSQGYAERRYAAESAAADRLDWRPEEERLDYADAALVPEPNELERDPIEWQNPSEDRGAESERPAEKAPLIVYPQGSLQRSPSPADTDPSFPIAPRPLAPGRSPQAPRQPPRGPPPRYSQPRARRPLPQQAMPRNDVVPVATGLLTRSRQLPPQAQRGGELPIRHAVRPQPRPRPRPGVRPRPRPRPRPHLKPSGGGLLDGIYSAGKRVECATKNALSDVRLQDKAFVQEQLNCVLDRGHCDQTGLKIKHLTPEIIRGVCPAPCDQCTNQQIRKIMAQIATEYPRQWQEILAKMSNG